MLSRCALCHLGSIPSSYKRVSILHRSPTKKIMHPTWLHNVCVHPKDAQAQIHSQSTCQSQFLKLVLSAEFARAEESDFSHSWREYITQCMLRGFGACTVVCQDWEKPLPGRYLSYESGIPPGEIGSTRLSGGVWSLCWNQKLPMACFGKLTKIL